MRIVRKIVVAAGLLLSVGLAHAQAIYANVSATVTDPNAHPLAGAQYTATLLDTAGRTVTSATSPNGQIVSAVVQPGILDASGTFSVPLLQTQTLTKPSNTQWSITISPPPLSTQAYILTYQPPWTITYQTAVTADIDLTSQLSSLTNPINFINLKTGQNTLASPGGGCAGTDGFLAQFHLGACMNSPIDNGVTYPGQITSSLPQVIQPTDGVDQGSLSVSGESEGQSSDILDVTDFLGTNVVFGLTGSGASNPGALYLLGQGASQQFRFGPSNSQLMIGNAYNYLTAGLAQPNNALIFSWPGVGSALDASFMEGSKSGRDEFAIGLNVEADGTIPVSSKLSTQVLLTGQDGDGNGGIILSGSLFAGASLSPIAKFDPVNVVFSNTGTTNFLHSPVLMPAGSMVDGSLICTPGNALCGAAGSLTLTTTGSSGAATLFGSTLNIPVYVAPTGAYLALNPAASTNQQVTEQPGTQTVISQTSIGNVLAVNPAVINMYSLGQGFDNGNNGSSAQGWAGQGGLTINAYSATSGIMQGLHLNCSKNAIGDFACIYMYADCYGGLQDVSGEACQGMTIQALQSPWFNGAVITPGIGQLTSAFSPVFSPSNTYIWNGGGTAQTTFPTSGNLATFSVTYTSAATAQTAHIGTITFNAGGTVTFGAPVAISISAGTGTKNFTPTDFGTIPITQGQSLYFNPGGTGNGPASSSIPLLYVTGAAAAGTYTPLTGGSGGILMQATLAPPAAGANSVSVAAMNCNVNCTNPYLKANFPDGGLALITTEPTTTAVLGAESIVMGGMSYTLTSGTVPVSTAWGNIIGSSCTNNGPGQYGILTQTTCNVTIGTSPASPGNFVTSGGITSCPVVAVSPGTSLDIHLSGQFSEEAYVTNVGTASGGIQSITFCTRHAYNNSGVSARVMQGGPVSKAIVNTAVLSSWPVAYVIDGAFTSTQMAISNCRSSACNGSGGPGGILPSGTAVTILSAAYITGSGNGAFGTASLGTWAGPLAVADNVVGAPSSEVSLNGIRIVCGQWTPIDGAIPSGCATFSDMGGTPLPFGVSIGNSGSSSNLGVNALNITGWWQNGLHFANGPVGGSLIELVASQGSTNLFKTDDSNGVLNFTHTGSTFVNQVLSWSEGFNAYAYQANGSYGTPGQCLITGGTAGPASYGSCGGGGGNTITINGGAALGSPTDFRNGSAGAGQITFANPTGNEVEATLANVSMSVNGVPCSLAGTCTLPSVCGGSGSPCNLQQINPTAGGNSTTTAIMTTSQTTIPVASGTGFTFTPGNIVALENVSQIEWAACTGYSGGNLTGCTRGFYGTSAIAWGTGTLVIQMVAGNSAGSTSFPYTYILSNGAQGFGQAGNTISNTTVYGGMATFFAGMTATGLVTLSGGSGSTAMYSPQAIFSNNNPNSCATAGARFTQPGSGIPWVIADTGTGCSLGSQNVPAGVIAFVAGSAGANPTTGTAPAAWISNLGEIHAAASLTIGSAPPTACGAFGCWALGETSSTACSPVAGVDCVWADPTTHRLLMNTNAGTTGPLRAIVTGPLTYTTATSDAATITGVTSASSCTITPTNATAAGSTVAASYAATTNTVTVSHVATTANGGTVSIMCTVN